MNCVNKNFSQSYSQVCSYDFQGFLKVIIFMLISFSRCELSDDKNYINFDDNFMC